MFRMFGKLEGSEWKLEGSEGTNVSRLTEKGYCLLTSQTTVGSDNFSNFP